MTTLASWNDTPTRDAIAAFAEFPPRQKAATFTIDQAVEKLQAVETSGH